MYRADINCQSRIYFRDPFFHLSGQVTIDPGLFSSSFYKLHVYGPIGRIAEHPPVEHSGILEYYWLVCNHFVFSFAAHRANEPAHFKPNR
jgi:hypothetical protein